MFQVIGNLEPIGFRASPDVRDRFRSRRVIQSPQSGAVKREMLAREVFGEEKDEWWKRADAAYSKIPAYRARAGREIPMLVLEPLRSPAESSAP
jgi:hypothetical protein